MFSSDQIADVQGFNKVYLYLCKRIDSAILDAGYSLTEKDVLLEISKAERCTANILTHQLHIDRSYMSRMIAKFEKNGLIEKTLSKTDSRVRYIRLTEKGRREFNRLSDIQSAQIRNIFQKLSDEDQRIVLDAMTMIRSKLSDVFSAYVDRIVYEFADKYDPETDCLNILECNSVPAGSITVAKADRDTAQIRFFMLEPEMRRRGYGNRLIDLAIDFCRKKGYKRVFVLTITTQVVARHVYETHGFYKVWSRDKSEWGDGIVEERWDLEL